MHTEFKAAETEDAKLLVDIYNASFYDDYVRYGECTAYGRTVESMQESIINYPKFKIICDGQPVGVISCKMIENGLYEIGCLCVVPEFQGKGIGTKAFRFVSSYYADWTKFTVKTPADKTDNVMFYTKKCGFKIDSEEMDGNVEPVRFILER